jgi:hypothetical protein
LSCSPADRGCNELFIDCLVRQSVRMVSEQELRIFFGPRQLTLFLWLSSARHSNQRHTFGQGGMYSSLEQEREIPCTMVSYCSHKEAGRPNR